MPDSYGFCFTGVGRERIVSAEIATIMMALAMTNPNNIRTGKYARLIEFPTS
jgi:hypothetical protein